jgi:hypothetical protein
MALQLGYGVEQRYSNGEGQMVRWKLKEIISLDIIPEMKPTGVEVYAEPVYPKDGETFPFEEGFSPRTLRPHGQLSRRRNPLSSQ